jgi:hypothetical protein
MRTRHLLPLLLAILSLLAACGPREGKPAPDGGPTPTTAPGATAAPGATTTPTATPLPTRTVRFSVRVPTTPGGDPVYLLLRPFHEWAWDEHILLTEGPGGVWTGEAALPEGTLVYYVYDHWASEEYAEFNARREAHGERTEVYARFLHVSDGLSAVDDVVERWVDARATALPTGSVSGVVVDAVSGEPLPDTNVTLGGLHIATDYAGRFTFRDVAAGNQRITAHRDLHDYGMDSVVAQVPEGGTAEGVRIALEPAPVVDVTFTVALPSDTPADAEVRINGSAFITGARSYFPNQPLSGQGEVPVVLERDGARHASVTLPLRAGMPLAYYYTIGGTGSGREHDANDRQHNRRVMVGDGPTQRVSDAVDRWFTSFSGVVELRVRVPADTPPGTPVFLVRGPSSPLAWLGGHEYVGWVSDFPGTDSAFHIVLGNTIEGKDASAAAVDGERSVPVGEGYRVAQVVVERWESGRDVTAVSAGQNAQVRWRVSVPEGLSTGDALTVEFEGGRSALALAPLEGDPSLWTATSTLPAGQATRYRVRGPQGAGPWRTVTPTYTPWMQDDWVIAWDGAPAPAEGTRPGYISGLYLPDFWGPQAQALSDQSFARMRAHNGGWVAVSSVWAYGNIKPTPTVESRRFEALAGVETPRPELVKQIEKAHAAGLSVLLAPQFNMEQSPGGIGALHDLDLDWWDAWLGLAEQVWLWNAQVAQETGAEALLLPGYVFHVFAQPGAFPTQEDFEAFDARVGALVARVREVYDGRLLMSGGITESESPGLVDLVGVTTFDTGAPDLPASATADEWAAAYEAQFAERLDQRWERWGVPVLFYTIHVNTRGTGEDGEAAQARQLEGAMRAIAARPWVAGSFSWAYHYVNAPTADDDGLRGRLAEAVLARWYGLFTGGE